MFVDAFGCLEDESDCSTGDVTGGASSSDDGGGGGGGGGDSDGSTAEYREGETVKARECIRAVAGAADGGRSSISSSSDSSDSSGSSGSGSSGNGGGGGSLRLGCSCIHSSSGSEYKSPRTSSTKQRYDYDYDYEEAADMQATLKVRMCVREIVCVANPPTHTTTHNISPIMYTHLPGRPPILVFFTHHHHNTAICHLPSDV